jgi:inhibitor of KinA
MEIVPLGDSAVIVHLGEKSLEAGDESLEKVLDALQKLNDAKIPGILELAPAYTTISIFFDPGVVMAASDPVEAFQRFTGNIRAVVSKKSALAKTKPRMIEIPVCYDREFALDLDEVAQHARLSPNEVVDLHACGEYRVACVGFTGGFPFLVGLPKKLATPRRSEPRKEIPAGSVGIGGAQTGIYPVKSPGGWNLIGRTPLRLFDPQQTPPALLRIGDRVRFRSISRAEFERSTS